MKKYFGPIGIILFSLLTLYSCIDDDNGIDPIIGSEENIAQVVTGSDNLQSLAAALQRTDLVAALESGGPFTVLAPTDEAFADFLSENGYASLEEVPVEVLEQVLLNHVIAAPITTTDFITGQVGYASTIADSPSINLAKLSLFFDTSDGISFNGEAVIDQNRADIGASNGVIHVINNVLELPTVATFIAADPIFESLEDALNRDDQADFKAVLERAADTSPAPFTVFAPINEAFA
ncbi:MAG: fasciclin domain-containing protein, partial [Pricia sp.]